MKKITAILLTVCLVLSLSAAAFADGESDIEIPDDWKMLYGSSGSEGGVYYTICVSWGEMAKKDFGISLQCEPAGGGSANFYDIATNPYNVGLTCDCYFLDGVNSKLPSHEGEQLEDVRALAPLYPSTIIFVTRDPDIKSFSDCDGKVIHCGPSGGIQNEIPMAAAEVFGIEYTPVYGSYNEGATALQDGTVDVMLASAGHPIAAITELETTVDSCYMFGFTEEESEELLAAYPQYISATIPDGCYKNQTGDILSVCSYSMLACNVNVPDEVAYALTKAFWDNYDQMYAVASGLGEKDPEELALCARTPYHEGAIQFYEDNDMADYLPETAHVDAFYAEYVE